MLLKDQPTIKEVAKVFIVGLALRSYLADGDGQSQQRRTCFGHELSRRICIAANRNRPRSQRQPFMSPERRSEFERRNKQRAIKQQDELRQRAQQFAAKGAAGDNVNVNVNVK